MIEELHLSSLNAPSPYSYYFVIISFYLVLAFVKLLISVKCYLICLFKYQFEGLECSSVAECLPDMHEAFGTIWYRKSGVPAHSWSPALEQYRQEDERIGVVLGCAALPLPCVLAHAAKICCKDGGRRTVRVLSHTQEKRTSLIVVDCCF